MSGKLRYTLVVRHPETSLPAALVEGSEVPDWASDLVHADDLDGADKEQDEKPARRRATSDK